MKKLTKVLFLLCLVMGMTACSNPNDKTNLRQTSFNNDWKFYLGDAEEAVSNTFDDSNWRTLNLPHDWAIEGDFSDSHPSGNSGGALPGGIGWYRKTFTLDKNDQGKKIFIDFDGVHMNSTVYLNGEKLGFRPFGYISFSYDLTPYLKWDEHCRIGHALALGTNPMHYYELRGWNVITTRQVLLDNLVWFVQMCDVVRYRIGKVQREEIEDKIQSLYEEIGYSEDFDLGKYTDSMRLRGDHPIGAGRAEGLSLFAQTALDDDYALEALRGDAEVSTMFHEYYNDKNIRKEGEDLTFWKMPREMVGAVSRIQKYLFHKIATKRIAIETCPTSNYMIGYFDKYIDLPLFTFMEQLPDNAISINTDDKGIIATSVENEYALVSAVMEKSRKYKGKANEVIERVVKDARKSRFNVP